jgi:hypothetical protein
MPRDIAGNYTLPQGINPVAQGTVIASSWANTTLDDLEFAMTDSLSRTGSGGMLTALPLSNGSATNPSLTFVNDLTTGRYLFAPDDMRDVASGVDVLRYNNGTVTVWVDPNWVSVYQSAAEVAYDNSTSGLTATDVQAALDELDGSIAGNIAGKYDKTGGVITGDVTIDVATTDAASLNILNDEGGGAFAVDGGTLGIRITDSAGGNVKLGLGVFPDGLTALYYDVIQQLNTSATGGALTNVWTGPTAAAGTNNTQLATTAYVDAAVATQFSSGSTPDGNYAAFRDPNTNEWQITQWGHSSVISTSTSIVFPLQFAVAPSVALTGVENAETDKWAVTLRVVTTTGFTARSSSTFSGGFDWIAQGTL